MGEGGAEWVKRGNKFDILLMSNTPLWDKRPHRVEGIADEFNAQEGEAMKRWKKEINSRNGKEMNWIRGTRSIHHKGDESTGDMRKVNLYNGRSEEQQKGGKTLITVTNKPSNNTVKDGYIRDQQTQQYQWTTKTSPKASIKHISICGKREKSNRITYIGGSEHCTYQYQRTTEARLPWNNRQQGHWNTKTPATVTKRNKSNRNNSQPKQQRTRLLKWGV